MARSATTAPKMNAAAVIVTQAARMRPGAVARLRGPRRGPTSVGVVPVAVASSMKAPFYPGSRWPRSGRRRLPLSRRPAVDGGLVLDLDPGAHGRVAKPAE